MANLIDRLRDKPLEHRQAVTFGAAFAFTGVVALVWATAIGQSGMLVIDSEKAKSQAAAVVSPLVASPAGSIPEEFKSRMQDLQKALEQSHSGQYQPTPYTLPAPAEPEYVLPDEFMPMFKDIEPQTTQYPPAEGQYGL